MLSHQAIPQEMAAWEHLAILHLLGTNPTPPVPPRKRFWYPFIWIEVSLTSSSMSYRTACTHPWSRKHSVSHCITAQTPRLPVLEREVTTIPRGWLLFANTIHSHCWVTHGGTVAPEWGKVNALLALSALCQVTFEYPARTVQQISEKHMSRRDKLFSRIKALFKHHSDMSSWQDTQFHLTFQPGLWRGWNSKMTYVKTQTNLFISRSQCGHCYK